MKRFFVPFVLAAAAFATTAQAVSLEPASVVLGDPFAVEVVGYNQSAPAQNIYLIASNLQPAFGTTNQYPALALNGQTLTISSTQYVSNGNFNDFITMSVPSNFVPAGTRDNGNNIINAIQFSIGNYLGGTNPLDFIQPLTNYTVTGSLTFVSGGVTSSGAVPMTTTLTNGGKSLSTFGAITSTGDISNSDITSFSILVTYAVPEPSTYAMFALGTAGLFMVVVRRRRCA